MAPGTSGGSFSSLAGVFALRSIFSDQKGSISELCIFGFCCAIWRRWAELHTMNAFMGRFTFSKGSPPETTGLPAPSRSWEPEDEELGAVGVGGSSLQACEEPGSAIGGEGKP